MSKTILREATPEIETRETIRFQLDEIPRPFRWISALPQEEKKAFFLELLEACLHPDNIKQIIEEWKETANVYADSERLADIIEAEAELAQGGGEDWEQLRQELKI